MPEPPVGDTTRPGPVSPPGLPQRQAHKTWKAPAADTFSALRSALSLDGELPEQ
ncbi:hypothetical protein ACFCWB_10520 [Streptomyces bacillaris]|uniref:hypothetical protein n=1 Tax=Streptomyces bacillaris TaxID=68179 RepID=UPI0035D91335